MRKQASLRKVSELVHWVALMAESFKHLEENRDHIRHIRHRLCIVYWLPARRGPLMKPVFVSKAPSFGAARNGFVSTGKQRDCPGEGCQLSSRGRSSSKRRRKMPAKERR